MTDLVTGATGFVGMRFCALLRAEGRSVRAAVRPDRSDDGKLAALTALGVETVPVSLLDAAAVERALDGVGTLYHLAWKLNRMSRAQGFQPVASPAEENLAALSHLIQGAKRAEVRRLVFSSTVSVYGPETEWGPTPRREDDALPGLDAHANPYFRFYAAAKARAEALIRDACPPPEYVIIRPAMVYGAGAQFAAALLRDAVNGTGAGSTPHPVQWVHVDDVARALALAGERPEAAGKTFNIAGDSAILNHTVAAEIGRLATGRGGAEPLDWNPRVPRYDIRAAERLLGFRPQIGWHEGLADMVRHETHGTKAGVS